MQFNNNNEMCFAKNDIDSNFINLEETNELINSTCKIEVGSLKGSGFFIQLDLGKGEKIYLATNNHIITREYVNKSIIMWIFCDGGENKGKKISIELNQDKRHIRLYKEPLDIAFVEMLNDDSDKPIIPFHGEKLFYNNPYNAKGLNALILQHPNYNYLTVEKGRILDVKNYELLYKINTAHGSSGSPIILEGSTNVLGIHKGYTDDKKFNRGTLLGAIFANQKELNNIHNNENDNICSYKDSIGNSYIGEIKDNKKEGYGLMKYTNKNLYVGEWKNDLKHGYGIFEYNNCNKYIGNWFNDIPEGKGTMIFGNGEIYSGNYKNGKMEGKGIKINYEGENFIYIGERKNDLKEGKGTMIYANGDKYIGDWRYNERQGKEIYKTNIRRNLSEGQFITGNDYKIKKI